MFKINSFQFLIFSNLEIIFSLIFVCDDNDLFFNFYYFIFVIYFLNNLKIFYLIFINFINLNYMFIINIIILNLIQNY